jgi:hypothetical protein
MGWSLAASAGQEFILATNLVGLLVIAITGGGPRSRNDTVHYRGSTVQQRCVEHGRVYADGGRIVRDAAWRLRAVALPPQPRHPQASHPIAGDMPIASSQ